MGAAEPFFDTGVVLYLLSADDEKADRAEDLLADGGAISVQVLNEFVAVATRKLGFSIAEAREALAAVRDVCVTHAVTEESHERGLAVAERYGFALFDSMLIAAALLAGCTTLYSEDLQHRQLIEGRLRIVNPFV